MMRSIRGCAVTDRGKNLLRVRINNMEFVEDLFAISSRLEERFHGDCFRGLMLYSKKRDPYVLRKGSATKNK